MSGKKIAISLSMLLALTLLTSCSKKEDQKITDEAAAEGNQALTDEQLMQDLPPEGTPEYDAIKKQYLEQRMNAVQQKQAGAAVTAGATAGTASGATPTPPSGNSAISAEMGQEAAAGTASGTIPSQGAKAGVTPGSTAGGLRRATIESNYPCRIKTECTFTKFSNTPKDANECGCQAACTPFVVNKSEKNRRESANKQHCTNNDWFGDQCPAPSCGFVEFDDFDCISGKCVGYALGQ